MRDEPRPFSEFQEDGLLWLVNVSVFHPRGYALTFHKDDDGIIAGWSLQGDGSEPWTMPDSPALDALMLLAKQALS